MESRLFPTADSLLTHSFSSGFDSLCERGLNLFILKARKKNGLIFMEGFIVMCLCFIVILRVKNYQEVQVHTLTKCPINPTVLIQTMQSSGNKDTITEL